MASSERIIDQLLQSLRGAAIFNPEIQVAPACILWPDRDRQWQAVIPVLQAELPELLVLGDYAPDRREGPAIWLRCVIAGKIEGITVAKNQPPILYLPGVSRQDLRAVESCPDHLKPLAELQYRGTIWSQLNGKDWTIMAYLKSDQGGLGLDVAQDNETKHSMQLALYLFLDEELQLLQNKRLDRDYFNTLLTGGDPVRDLLQWLDQGDTFRDMRSESEWQAFISVCKSQLAFNPENEGVLAGCAKLAEAAGPWHGVWERFCEAPARYRNIPAQIGKCKPPSHTIFWLTDNGSFDGWPQWNEEQENRLRQELKQLADHPAFEARKKILELEKQQGRRRALVWAELGEAPLALALEHLAAAAQGSKTGLAVGTVDDLIDGYVNHGWKVDDDVIRALSYAEKHEDLEAISAAVRSIYLPWAEDAARHLQKIWSDPKAAPAGVMKEDCILFVDGLRFDCAKRLSGLLEDQGCAVDEKLTWAALPSVTGTGKPAVAPLAVVPDTVADAAQGYNFEPMTPYQLHKTIKESGYTILEKNSPCPSPSSVNNKLWTEFGDLDHEGHNRGWKLARHLDDLLAEIRDRITSLLSAGWQGVRVVTDHGWLLLPGGLPKVELAVGLTESKWGRCASLKPGAKTSEHLYPWYWNPDQHFVLADGVSCFRHGEEYSHGGISLQECLTLQLTISHDTASSAAHTVEITDIVWKGLRCTVAVDGRFADLSLDVRSWAGDPSSSVVLTVKPFKANGTASVIVVNEDLEGKEVTVVLIDGHGAPAAQQVTVIGGVNND